MTNTWLVAITVAGGCRRLFRGGKLDGHALHRDLMRLAPDDLGPNPRQRSGLLYRAEHGPGRQGLRILAQLTYETEPHLHALAPDLAAQVQHRRLTPLLEALAPGVRVRYRIDANATKRHGNQAEPHKRGKLANLHGTDAELWWLRKATDAGLHPMRLTSTPQPDILGSPTKAKARRGGGQDTEAQRYSAVHGVTRFEGIGIVTDPERLREAVTTGIGRARTYGCGLLSLGLTQEQP